MSGFRCRSRHAAARADRVSRRSHFATINYHIQTQYAGLRSGRDCTFVRDIKGATGISTSDVRQCLRCQAIGEVRLHF